MANKERNLPWPIGVLLIPVFVILSVLIVVSATLSICAGALIGQVKVKWKTKNRQ